MKYLQLVFLGDNRTRFYIWTILLLFSTLIGFGQIPYVAGLMNAGVSMEQMGEVGIKEGISILGKNLFLTLQLVPFILLLITLVFCVTKIHKQPAITLFTSRNSFDWKRYFYSLTLYGSILSATTFISVMLGAPIKWNMNPTTIILLTSISLLIIPLQSAFEDVLFRGYILQGLSIKIKRPLISIMISGILFGLMHSGNPEVTLLGKSLLIYYILTGVFLGIVSVMDDGLELGMGFHTANNIFGTLIITNNWQVFQTDALWIDTSPARIGWDLWVSLFLIYPIMLFIFSKKYAWAPFKNYLLKKEV